jgi:hypothetical protein
MEKIGTRWYAEIFGLNLKASIYYGYKWSPDGKGGTYGYYAEILHPRSFFYQPEKLGFYRTKEEAETRLKNDYPHIAFN